MKYLIILTDGMADYLIPEIGNKTPLQAANTPNIDYLARHSIIGTVATIPPGFPPGSDVANLSVLGYEPSLYYTGRSPLEAASMGIELAESDLTLRCNLVTLSEEPIFENKYMLDYSAGEIDSHESLSLITDLNKLLGNDILSLYAGMSYRHLMIWKGGSESRLTLTPPHDITDQAIGAYLPQGPDAYLLKSLMIKAHEFLKNHPVNLSRMNSGKKPANSIWFWGAGKKVMLPSFKEKYGIEGSVVAAVDLVKGLGICSGLTPVLVDGATGSIETNFSGKAQAALNELKSGKDFVYLHIESPDEAGHQGNLRSKIWSIEQIDDKVIGYILSELPGFKDIRIMILPDHPTPVSLKTHSSEPVPFMIYDKSNTVENGIKIYDVISAQKGMVFFSGHELMNYFLER